LPGQKNYPKRYLSDKSAGQVPVQDRLISPSKGIIVA